MKKTIVCLMVLAMLFTVGSVNAAQKRSKPNAPYGLARGFANVMFGWAEIPRGIIYENARIPIVGFFTGAVKGTFLTAWREIGGVVDLMSMGLSREGAYFGQLPDFVWDAEWIPACGEDIVDSKNLDYRSCTECMDADPKRSANWCDTPKRHHDSKRKHRKRK